jgi:hypothetical protein
MKRYTRMAADLSTYVTLDGFFKMILARSPGFKGIVVRIWILDILSFR